MAAHADWGAKVFTLRTLSARIREKRKMKMLNKLFMWTVTAVIFTALSGLCLGQTCIASPDNIGGKVEGGGGPIAKASKPGRDAD
jgi:hypothetical protein